MPEQALLARPDPETDDTAGQLAQIVQLHRSLGKRPGRGAVASALGVTTARARKLLDLYKKDQIEPAGATSWRGVPPAEVAIPHQSTHAPTGGHQRVPAGAHQWRQLASQVAPAPGRR